MKKVLTHLVMMEDAEDTLKHFSKQQLIGAVNLQYFQNLLFGRTVIKMNKPMIRHCGNCEWCESKSYSLYKYHCDVLYKRFDHGRLRALLCRHYKQKGGGSDE